MHARLTCTYCIESVSYRSSEKKSAQPEGSLRTFNRPLSRLLLLQFHGVSLTIAFAWNCSSNNLLSDLLNVHIVLMCAHSWNNYNAHNCSTHVLHTRAPHTCSTHVLHTRAPHTCSTHVLHTRAPQTCSTHVLHRRAPHTCSTHVLHTRAPHTCARSASFGRQTYFSLFNWDLLFHFYFRFFFFFDVHLVSSFVGFVCQWGFACLFTFFNVVSFVSAVTH